MTTKKKTTNDDAIAAIASWFNNPTSSLSVGTEFVYTTDGDKWTDGNITGVHSFVLKMIVTEATDTSITATTKSVIKENDRPTFDNVRSAPFEIRMLHRVVNREIESGQIIGVAR